MAKIAVIGAGAWGSALAVALGGGAAAGFGVGEKCGGAGANSNFGEDGGANSNLASLGVEFGGGGSGGVGRGAKNEVVIASRTPRDLPNFVGIDEALGAEYLIFAISTQNVRGFLEAHRDALARGCAAAGGANDFSNSNLNKNGKRGGDLNSNQNAATISNSNLTSSPAHARIPHKILVASKGVETASGAFLHEIFGEFFAAENLAFLSGPSFAAEVRRGLPCALVISSANPALAAQFATLFPPQIKIYASADVVGAEVCGAYKNVIAIASGVCAGLGLGQNARASLISRGLVEMCRFGRAFGACEETFLGLGGAGDLFLTACSEMSRNYRVGLGLAGGRGLAEVLGGLGEVAEGVATTAAVVKIARSRGIYTPVAEAVASVLGGAKSPRECVWELLRR